VVDSFNTNVGIARRGQQFELVIEQGVGVPGHTLIIPVGRE
jgi:hypothetical protein